MRCGRTPSRTVLLLLSATVLPSAGAADRARPEADDRDLAAARIIAVEKLRATEAEADEAATRMDSLSRRREALKAELDARAAAIAPLLPLAERMRLDPTEALLAANAPPDEALHGLLVLRGLAHRLEREAEALRSEQDEVARLSREVAATAPRLRAAQAAQAAQADALDQALALARQRQAREDAEDQARRAARKAAEQVAQRAAEAYSVGGAVDRLDSARRRDTPRPSPLRREVLLSRPVAPVRKGAGVTRLAVPVTGRIVQGWGSPTDAGPAGGLTYRAPPRARVSASCTGRIAFAGPFRSFGLLVILDCGGGYDVVLSGFASLDVQVGRTVQSGEPIGTMPGWDPEGPGSRPGLYVELRRDGRRIDPSPFLNARG